MADNASRQQQGWDKGGSVGGGGQSKPHEPPPKVPASARMA